MFSLLVVIVGTIFFAGALAIALTFPRKSKGLHQSGKNNAYNSQVHPQYYTASEVSKHKTAKDCWIIIKNKVYDVTPYVEEHPGGYAILNHAGDDSTEGFYGPQHASRVFDMVDEFYIGELTK